jgi:hypothetical protein
METNRQRHRTRARKILVWFVRFFPTRRKCVGMAPYYGTVIAHL